MQQEQEIEIEKYVDLAYSREEEEPTPWLFGTLRSTNTPQFYDLNEFHLYKYVKLILLRTNLLTTSSGVNRLSLRSILKFPTITSTSVGPELVGSRMWQWYLNGPLTPMALLLSRPEAPIFLSRWKVHWRKRI